jgi:hypothetical protein
MAGGVMRRQPLYFQPTMGGNALSIDEFGGAGLRDNSAFVASICRSFTNARTTITLVCAARSLFSTFANISAPCPVKA